MPQVIASRRAAWRRGFHVNNGRADPGVEFLGKLYVVNACHGGPPRARRAGQGAKIPDEPEPETRPFRTPSPADK
jgi:hypothetical protein